MKPRGERGTAGGLAYLRCGSQQAVKGFTMSITHKYLILLIILCITDVVIPVPILGVTLIYIVLQKPLWFTDAVSKIYDADI